jgi:hypothetical protein
MLDVIMMYSNSLVLVLLLLKVLALSRKIRALDGSVKYLIWRDGAMSQRKGGPEDDYRR